MTLPTESPQPPRPDTATAAQVFADQAYALLQQPEPPPLPDPAKVQRTAEAALIELGDAQADGTPALLDVPDHPAVTWVDLLHALLARCHEEVGRPGAKRTLAPPDAGNRLSLVLEECEAARRRLVMAIDGNRSNHLHVSQLRTHILGGRAVSNTRPGWESEIGAILSAISGLGDGAPAPVKALVPRFQACRQRLAEAKPAHGGRPRSQTFVWSQEVQVSVLALHLGLGALLSWAAATATDRRLAALTRIIVPRRRGDSPKEEGSSSTSSSCSSSSSSAPSSTRLATLPPRSDDEVYG